MKVLNVRSVSSLFFASLVSLQTLTGCGNQPSTSIVPATSGQRILNVQNPFPPVAQPDNIKNESLPFAYGRIVIGEQYPKSGSVTVHFVNLKLVTDDAGMPRRELRGTVVKSTSVIPNKEGVYGVALPEEGIYKIFVGVKSSAYPGKAFAPFLDAVQTPLKVNAPIGPFLCDVVLPLREPGKLPV